MGFAANAADALGKDERSVRRLIAAAKSLDKDEVRKLRKAPKKVRLEDLQVLAKCNNAQDRDTICEALSTGSSKSAKEALAVAHAKPGDKLKDNKPDHLRKMADAWARASKAQRRQFVEDLREPLEELLSELDAASGVAEFRSRKAGAK